MKSRILQARRKHAIAGFTLLEVLVVVIIIAVLFAIAAPGWDALMNRQRVNTVREQAVQAIRQAQADARRSRIPRVVVFDPNPAGTPRFAILSRSVDAFGRVQNPAVDPTTVQNWQTFGNGDIRQGALRFLTTPPGAPNQLGQLVFDGNGAVAPVSATGPSPNVIFRVAVGQANTGPATNRCVIVTTLLGAVRLADGTDNANSDCPPIP